MLKIVNPLIGKSCTEDAAYNCACICHSGDSEGKSDASSWTWLPWNSCSCSCSDAIQYNDSGNDARAEAK